jgi:hypothetical protein
LNNFTANILDFCKGISSGQFVALAIGPTVYASVSSIHWRNVGSRLDAMQIARREPRFAAHLDEMLAHGTWIEAAEAAAYHCQIDALSLRPWQSPPAVADEDAPAERDKPARTLLRRMLAAGVASGAGEREPR